MKLILSVAVGALFLFQNHVQGQSEPSVGKKGQPNSAFFFKIDKTKERISKDQSVQAIRQKLKLSDHYSLQLVRTETDNRGNVHQRFQCYYKGIKVEHGIILVHTRGGIISSINGELFPVENIDIKANISEDRALGLAEKHVAAKTYMWESQEQEEMLKKMKGDEKATYHPKGELVIMNGQAAWKFDIHAMDPEGRDEVYIDANSGSLIEKNSLICNDLGSANTLYSGAQSINTIYDATISQYKLLDVSRGQGIQVYNLNNSTLPSTVITDYTNNTNNWEWNGNESAVDAFWGAEMTYDYWLNTHGRNSYNNGGAKINIWANYSNSYSASWDGSKIKLGDGSSSNGPKTSLDVIAHEFGHGIAGNTAQFSSYYEPGALNEGFSDIWAACTENYVNNLLGLNKNLWLFEDEIFPTGSGLALRSLSNPKQFNNPDTYRGQYWYDGDSSFDDGGEHINCTVLGHWFYILSVGKQGTNDKGFSYNVAGITVPIAASIAYDAERFYLTSQSGYYETRYATLEVAENLYDSSTAQTVAAAWDAVGVFDIFENTPVYCIPVVQNANANWIMSVKISTLQQAIKLHQHTNSSSALFGGYRNYINSGYVAELPVDQAYAIFVTGLLNSNNYYKVWIDYDKNGTFNDQNELVINAGPLDDLTQTIFIDPMTPLGFTRMRVAIKTGSSPESACEVLGDGEVEDYGIQFHESTWTTQPTYCHRPKNVTVPDASITTNSMQVNWVDESASGIGNYMIKYMNSSGSGPEIYVPVSNSLSAPISGLTPGTQYLIQVQRVCSPDLPDSYWSVAEFATTHCGTIQSIGATSITPTSATIIWTDPNPNGIYIAQYRKEGSGLNWTNANESGLSAPASGLSYGTNYEIRVRRDCTYGTDTDWFNGAFATTCPSPASLTATQSSFYGAATFSWSSVAGIGSYTFEFKEDKPGEPWTSYPNELGTTKTVNVLPGKNYRARVKSNCEDVNTYTEIIYQTPNYCTSQGINTTFEWIDFVAIGSLNNSSGSNGGYADNTNLAAPTLFKGSTQNIQLSLGNGSQFTRTRYFNVWIDFNRDGDFGEANEQVVFTTTTSSGIINPSFTIPSAALSGLTRMRVSVRYNSVPLPCGLFSYGETEDYLVNITTFSFPLTGGGQESLLTTESGAEENLSVYPNPVKDILNISGSNHAKKMIIRDVNGLKYYSGEPRQTLDVKDLPSNRMYILTIQGQSGMRNIKFIKE